jgi:hypothetical protein
MTMIGISGLKGPGLCKRICRSTFKIPKAGARVGELLKKTSRQHLSSFPESTIRKVAQGAEVALPQSPVRALLALDRPTSEPPGFPSLGAS